MTIIPDPPSERLEITFVVPKEVRGTKPITVGEIFGLIPVRTLIELNGRSEADKLSSLKVKVGKDVILHTDMVDLGNGYVRAFLSVMVQKTALEPIEKTRGVEIAYNYTLEKAKDT